jgi:hypothetical protein
MKQYLYQPEDRFNMPNADWHWIFPLENGYTHVKGHNVKYGLIKDGVLIIEPKYDAMVEIVEHVTPHLYLVRDTLDAPLYLMDAQNNIISPDDYEKLTGSSPAQFITYEPVTGGITGEIEYWLTKTYNEKLELVSSKEPDWM